MSNNPIAGLEWVVRYYIVVCFGPLKTSIISRSWRWLLIILYILSRGIGISKVLYEILLVLGIFEWKHGQIDAFGLLEAALWGCGMLPYVGSDLLLLNGEFLRNVEKSYLVMKSIMEDTAQFPKVTGGNSAAFKTSRFMIFSGSLDYFQYIFAYFALQGAMTERIHVYSVLPWQNPVLENLAWFLESFNLAVLFFIISVMTTLPGVFAYYLEECLRRMTDVVVEVTENRMNGDVVWRMLNQYRDLFYISRELNKVMGWGAMSFNTTNCIQQTAETYVIFQLLRAGASFMDLQFLFTDIFISASRVSHSFHAMGVVHGASEEFLAAVRMYLARSRQRMVSTYERKLFMSTLNSYQNINMTMGKTKCKSDFIFVGMSVYSNNYFTAALWP